MSAGGALLTTGALLATAEGRRVVRATGVGSAVDLVGNLSYYYE